MSPPERRVFDCYRPRGTNPKIDNAAGPYTEEALLGAMPALVAPIKPPTKAQHNAIGVNAPATVATGHATEDDYAPVTRGMQGVADMSDARPHADAYAVMQHDTDGSYYGKVKEV